jgi:hypothetical protein
MKGPRRWVWEIVPGAVLRSVCVRGTGLPNVFFSFLHGRTMKAAQPVAEMSRHGQIAKFEGILTVKRRCYEL